MLEIDQVRPTPNLATPHREPPLLRLLWLALMGLVLWPGGAIAQPQRSPSITPATDGTGTRVRPQGNRIDIEGGSRSSDGANLFHSFEQFGLSRDQIANFLSNPDIRNILGRVVGGDPSLINGLIQVTGGNSNLFLMNPAGVIFGPNARLNVPADFTATTANGIGFGDRWFHASGDNAFADLTGDPAAFAFGMTEPGAIVNAGILAVGEGRALGLLGGSVLNTGTLTAPGGRITVAAIPGQQRVVLQQEGVLLGLEIQPLVGSAPNQLPYTPQTLPILLTGGNTEVATGAVVNADGTVDLVGSGTRIPTAAGTAIAAGTLDAAGTRGGEIAVVGDRVGVISAQIDASGTTGGGHIRIGGDYQGQGTLPNATTTVISADSTLRADALEQGDGGRVIAWADRTTRFGGTVSAQGGAQSGNGGFVEISGHENLDFRGQVTTFAPNGLPGTLLLDPTSITVIADPGSFTDLTQVDAFADPDIGDNTISAALLNAAIANVTLQALTDITFNAPVTIAAPGVGLTAEANNSIFVNANLTTQGGDVRLFADRDGSGAGSITVTGATVASNGGSIVLGGGITPLFTAAAGTPNGILLENSTLNAGTGAIALRGNAAPGVSGVNFDNAIAGINLSNSTLQTTGDIDLVGRGGTAANFSHGVLLQDGASIITNAGTVTINGTALGGGQVQRGIQIYNNSSITATGAGAIDLVGVGGPGMVGAGFASGIDLVINAQIVSGGRIDLNGTGGNGAGSQNTGVVISGNSGLRVTGIGSLLQVFGQAGTATNESQGILVQSNSQIRADNATVALSGSNPSGAANNVGIRLQTSQISSGGLVSLAADEIDADAGSAISGTNELVLQPFNPSQAIALGGTTDTGLGTLDLLGAELATLQNGFTNITIGAADGTGGLTLGGNVTLNDPTTLRSPLGLGSITTNGFDISGNTRLTLQSGSSIFFSAGTVISSNGGPLEVSINADRDGVVGGAAGSGEIVFDGTQILSSGGNISLWSGGSTPQEPAPGSAFGFSPRQVILNNSTILNAGGGNILVIGQGDDEPGLTLESDSLITTSGAGTIRLYGDISDDSFVSNDGIALLNNSTVRAENGSITLTGRTNAPDTLGNGVAIVDSLVEATGTGSITLDGTATTLGTGVFADRVRSNTGAIQITGTGVDNINNFNPSTEGVAINEVTSTGGGAITITGSFTGVQNAAGIRLNSATSRVTSAGGPIRLTGSNTAIANNPGIQLNGGQIASGTGGIELIADEMDLQGGTLQGTGPLTLQPLTATQTVRLGDGVDTGANRLDLLSSDLAALQNGFSSITIGRTDGSGDFQVAGDVTFTDPVTLRSATRVNTGGAITGTDNASITLNAREVSINAPITTPGNPITLTATNGPVDGIVLFSPLNSNGGDITLNGTGAESGVYLETGATLTSGGGAIAINGISTASGPSRPIGIYLVGNSIASGGGAITLNGTGNGAVDIILDGAIASDGGDITITGTRTPGSINPTLALTNGSISAGTGNITITGDAPAIDINLGSTISGSGTLVVQPLDAALPITVGGTGVNFLDTEELQSIQNGFSSIVLGRADGGNITLGGEATFSDPVTLRSQGAITTTSPLTGVDNAAFTFTAPTALNGDVATAGGPITFNQAVTVGEGGTLRAGAGAIAFNSTVNAGVGNFSLFADEINFAGPVSGTGALALTAGQADTPIVAGGTGDTPNTLNLTAAELENLQNGFSSITIGQEEGRNPITVASAVTFNDPTTLRSLESITINGTLTGADNASMTFVAPTSLNADIITTNNPITFSQAVTVGAGATLRAGAGAIAFNSTVNAGVGNFSLFADEINFAGPVSGTGNLTLTAGQASTPIGVGGTGDTPNTLNLTATELDNLQNGFSSITVGASEGGAIQILGPVTVSDPLVLSTAETITVTPNGFLRGIDNASLSFAGAAILGETVSTVNQPITFNRSVTIAAPISLSAGNGSVVFQDAVTAGSNRFSVTGREINFGGSVSGTGSLTLAPPTGGAVALGSTTDSGADTLDLTRQELANLQNGFERIQFGTADTSTLTVNQDLTLNDPTTFAANRITTTGAITGADNASLRFEGLTTLNADLTTRNGDLEFTQNLALGADTVLSAGSNAVRFGGNVATRTQDLTVSANEIDFAPTGTISGSGTLRLLPGTTDGAIAVGGPDDSSPTTLDLTAAELSTLQDGFTGIIIGRTNGTGTLAIAGSTTFRDPLTLRTGETGSIAIDNPLTGGGDASLLLDGPTILRANLTTASNPVTFTGPVTVEGNRSIQAGSSTLQFDGRLAVGSADLTLVANEIDLNAAVTGTGRLTLQPGRGDTAIAVGNTDPSPTTLDITRSEFDRLQASNLQRLTIGQAGGGPITISPSRFQVPTTFLAGPDQITLTGGVNLGNNATIDFDGNTPRTLLDGDVESAEPLTLFGNVELNRTVRITTTAPNSGVTFEGRVDGNHDLAIAATGTVRFADAVGSRIPLSRLEVNSAQTAFSAAVTARGDIRLAGPVTTSGAPITAQTGAITLTRTLTSEGAANLNARGDITVGGNLTATGATLTSEAGAIALADANAGTGTANLRAANDLSFSSVTAGGGINLTAGGSITRPQGSSGALNSASSTTAGGPVTLTADRTIETGPITSTGTTGGAIRIAGQDITTGAIDSRGTSGTGGNVTLNAGRTLQAGAITSTGQTGGTVRLTARDTITTGAIDSSGTVGDGGDVFIDPTLVEVESINAQAGGNGTGGDITVISRGLFRARGSFTTARGTFSLATNQGGSITIDHGGGSLDIPFTIGDASVNGTQSGITDGSAVLTPNPDPIPLTTSFSQGNVRISTSRRQGNPTGNLTNPEGNPAPPLPPPVDSDPPNFGFPAGEVVAIDYDDGTGTISRLESQKSEQFASAFGLTQVNDLSPTSAAEALRRIEEQAGVRPAIAYLQFTPGGELGLDSQLELLLITADGQVTRKVVPGASRTAVLAVAARFRETITNPLHRSSTVAMMEPAQQLYNWFIGPLERELNERAIDNLVFITDAGLRALPLAALYNARTQQFLIEQYSIGAMPNLSLTDLSYSNLRDRNIQLLAMGTSEFTDQSALPAVGLELPLITALWPGEADRIFEGEAFTQTTLKTQPRFGIVHLATHASFQAGTPTNTYIQFSDGRLQIDQLRQLAWNRPPVELLVLSACRTAVGDRDAELGFAGAALQAGTRSVLASLWSVNDVGTAGLMGEFYHQLGQVSTRAEALRQAQIAMLRGQIRLEGNELHWSSGTTPLSPDLLQLELGDRTFTHPYFWSAFTLVGNPW